NVDIHGNDQINALHHVVAVLVIRAAAAGAGTHGDDELGVGHLVVESSDPGRHLVIDGAGDDHQVGLARRGPEGPGAEAVHVETGCPRCHYFDGAASQAERHGPH